MLVRQSLLRILIHSNYLAHSYAFFHSDHQSFSARIIPYPLNQLSIETVSDVTDEVSG